MTSSAVLDTERFQHCFIAWTASLAGVSGDIIAVDGRTLRRSYRKVGAKAPIHITPAWSAWQNMVLDQAKVADKSNGIVAAPVNTGDHLLERVAEAYLEQKALEPEDILAGVDSILRDASAFLVRNRVKASWDGLG